MTIKEEAKLMKKDAPVLAASSHEARIKALQAVKQALLDNKETVFSANKDDVNAAIASLTPEAVVKRLKFTEAKLKDCINGIDMLIGLPDPLGKITLNRELDTDLVLTRVVCPIGVIGVIFEARPDALVQISCLCIKSGNCAMLKGGKETARTNKALFEIIKTAVVKSGLPENCLFQCEQHNEIDELLTCDKDVDLIIPRGSNAFVQYIMNNTRIPVMGHADGICHVYVDKFADLDMALKVVLDAKTQYTAACNACETVLVHKDSAYEFLPSLCKAASEASIILNGCTETNDIIPVEKVIKDEDFRKEYLSLEMSIKVVDSVEEAVEHINFYGSHHTDAIITADDNAAEYFMQRVDSAGVYRNCSTRFADGFRYGFGAEVGISTSKIHARGPVGLEGLVTYKYKLKGNGQIVGDYASGAATFKHKDLPVV